MRKTIAFVVLVGAVAATAIACPLPVPEIDPATGLGALAAVGGAMLIIRGRRKN